MKQIVLSLTVVMLTAFGYATPTYSQDYANTPVTLSKEKVKIAGKIYYSHIVLEKQTLFSISKAYGVSTEEIYACNPNLKEGGLKKNSIIIIPAKSENDKDVAQATAANNIHSTTEIIVEKKVAHNEKATENVKENDSPRVEEKVKNKPEEKKDKPKRKKKTHTVRWFEDLDTIAEKYDITVEDLMLANNLTGRKLTNRQKLIIPTEEDITQLKAMQQKNEEVADNTLETEIENLAEQKDTQVSENKETFNENKFLFRKNRTDVSLILPLKADGINASKHNMDFYGGFLIAVQELGEDGININLNVFDITDQSTPITKNALAESDVVIGPVSSGNIANILNLASGACHIVSPLDPRAERLTQQNWNLIQAPTPHTILYKEMAEWIKDEKTPSDSVIFITEKGARDTGTYSIMRSVADSADLKYSTFSYSILEGRNILEPLSRLMTDKAMNRFIVASESEAFVNDVVRNLNLLIHNKYNVTLYAPAKIRSFETMEMENLHNTNLHLCLSYDIDYNDPKVRNFIMKYRALYNAEPSQFAFQGYDIARYYIRLCHRFGKRWNEMLDKNDEEMLQSSFKYRRIENGGWVNEGVRKVVYDKNWIIQRF